MSPYQVGMPPHGVAGLDRRHRNELSVDEGVPLGRDVKRLSRYGAGKEVLGDVGHERTQHDVGSGVLDEREYAECALPGACGKIWMTANRAWQINMQLSARPFLLSPEAEVASQP